MTYRLRANLSFCKVGERYIFLDVTADRYFALKPADDVLLSSMIEERKARTSLAISGPISALLSDGEGGAPLAPAHVRSASLSLIEGACSSDRRKDPFTLLALAQARRDVRCKPLSRLLHTADMPVPSPNPDLDWLAQLAASFERTSGIVGREGDCLPRSLALWRMLRRRNYDAQIIFGVKDLPFAAHCWVQSGNLLLNDRLESIRPFTPVLSR